MKTDFHKLILFFLEEIIYHGGKHNFVIFNLGTDYFIQVAAAKGDLEVRCEAVSNNYLEDDAKLSNEQIEKLVSLGWNMPPSEDDNFFLSHLVDSEDNRENLANMIVKTSSLVYNTSEITTESIVLNLE